MLPPLSPQIDKTLKKVTEGLSIFDDFWEQLQGTDNQNNREKLEAQVRGRAVMLPTSAGSSWLLLSESAAGFTYFRPLPECLQLKTEIKKLQRFRDQIKSWAASSEVRHRRSAASCPGRQMLLCAGVRCAGAAARGTNQQITHARTLAPIL